MKMRKLLAMLLTLSMVMSLAAPAFAEDEGGSSDVNVSDSADAGSEGGNTGSESGNTGSESGNTGSEGGNTGSEGGDTGSGDTGSGDTGSGDTGSGDTGSGDTGSGDTGSGDTGSGDTGSGDTGDGSDTGDNEENKDPEDPNAPVDPNAPENPENPGEPVDPNAPENPDKPVDPNAPENPENPDKPALTPEEEEAKKAAEEEAKRQEEERLKAEAEAAQKAQFEESVRGIFDGLVNAGTFAEYFRLWMEAQADDEVFQQVLEMLRQWQEERAAQVEPFIPPVSSTDVAPLVEAPKPTQSSTFSSRRRNIRKAAVKNVNTVVGKPDDRAPADNKNADELQTSKELLLDKDGQLKLQIKAWSTGVYTPPTTVSKAEPTDIVLVLDQSSTMVRKCMTCGEELYTIHDVNNPGVVVGYGHRRSHMVDYAMPKNTPKDTCVMEDTFYQVSVWDMDGDGVAETEMGYWYCSQDPTREAALRNAVDVFLDGINESNAKVAESELKHHIAAVTFGEYGIIKSYLKDNLTSDEIFPASYEDVKGPTNTGEAMEKALEILQADSSERKKVVVLFTDGFPDWTNDTAGDTGGGSGTGEKVHIDTANRALRANETIKQLGTTVYTIGVFDGANNTEYSTDGNLEGKSESFKANHFMNAMSSDCANNPVNMSTGLEMKFDAKGKRYLVAANSDELENIFKGISEVIGGGSSTSSPLGTNAIVRDTITTYFDVLKDNIEVYKEDAVGNREEFSDEDNITYKVEITKGTADSSATTVEVTGFDFSKDFVVDEGGEMKGHKLVIEIPIKPNANFWGGNNVPTNVSSQSGIFAKTGENDAEECYKALITDGGTGTASPKANVKLKAPTVDKVDKNVYYSNDTGLTANDLISVSIPNDWKTDYIDRNPVVSFDPAATISYTADGSYTVKAHVLPKYPDGSSSVGTPVTESEDASVTASVNVFTPTIHFHDMRTYLTVEANVGSNQPKPEDIVWKHGTEVAGENDVTVIGTAPHVSCEIVGRVNDLHGEGTNQYDRDYYALVKSVTIGNVTVIHRDNQDKIADAMTTINGQSVPVLNFEHDPCTDIVKSIQFDKTAGEFQVHVFRPVVNFQDTTAYKGEKEYTKDEYIKKDYVPEVQWVYYNNPAKIIAEPPEGTAPTLDFTFQASADGVKDGLYVKDTKVIVTTKVDGKDMVRAVNVNDYVIYNWKPNSSSVGCTDTCAKPADANFTVHVLPCELTVEKVVTDGLYGENDTFVFHVVGSGNDLAKQVNLTIVLGGDNHTGGEHNNHTLSTSQKITDLPIGTYTVTEEGGWSWRYVQTGTEVNGAGSADGKVELSAERSSGTVTITNTQKRDNKWLSSEDFKVNTFNPIVESYPVTYATVPPKAENGQEL